MTHYLRGKKAAKTLLTGFHGYLVSDRLGSYNVHPPDKHQYCWAHVIRNLENMASRKGKAGRLGRRLMRQFRWCVHLQHQWQQHRQTQEDCWRQLRFLRRQIQRGIQSALAWKQPGGKDALSKTANQCKQLQQDEALFWTFLHHPTFSLPLTNNEAERALRSYVIFRKTSFFSQSARGEQFRPLINSIVETCKRQKTNLYQILRTACQQGIRGGRRVGTPAITSKPESDTAEAVNSYRRDKVFKKLKALLSPLNVKHYYTDDWGAYERHLEADKHEVGKRNTQKIERKNLRFRTWIKRLARRTICFSKNETMHDTVIGLLINKVEFVMDIYS